MVPKLPSLEIGDFRVAVDSISGHGKAQAACSIRHMPSDKAEGTVLVSAPLTRSTVVNLALDLLDLADQMMDEGAYGRGSALNPTQEARAVLERRSKDAAKRYFRLTDRLPILLMAQRVLERCDDEVAQGLLMMLGHAEVRGELPVKVTLQVGTGPASGGDGGPRRH